MAIVRLKRTPEVMEYVSLHGPTKSDRSIAIVLRKITGEKRWTKARVYALRRDNGIAKKVKLTNVMPKKIGHVSNVVRHRGEKERLVKVAPRKWIRYEVYLWEQAYGPLEKGMCVIHLDNDPDNFDLSNLQPMTKKDAFIHSRKYLKYDEQWRKNVSEAVKAGKRRQRKRMETNTYLSHKPYEFSR